jgi:hypothetical protein
VFIFKRDRKIETKSSSYQNIPKSDNQASKEKHYIFLSVNEIRNVIFEIQRSENLSCLALFILTHGEENGLLFGRDTNYRLNKDIVNELLPQTCRSLAGKPKMIFVQVEYFL